MGELQPGNVVKPGHRDLFRNSDSLLAQLGHCAKSHDVAGDKHGCRWRVREQARHRHGTSCPGEIRCDYPGFGAGAFHSFGVAELTLAAGPQRGRSADHGDSGVAEGQQVLRDHACAASVVRQLGRPQLGSGGDGDNRPAVVGDASPVLAHRAAIVGFFEAPAGEDDAGYPAQKEHLDIAKLRVGISIAAADHREKSLRRCGAGCAAHDFGKVRVADIVDDDRNGRDAPGPQRSRHRIRAV